MHIGETDGPALTNPMLRLGDRNDGAVSRDGLVSGCYVHGLFASDLFRAAFLGKLKDGTFGSVRYESMVETTLDDHLQGVSLSLADGDSGAVLARYPLDTHIAQSGVLLARLYRRELAGGGASSSRELDVEGKSRWGLHTMGVGSPSMEGAPGLRLPRPWMKR